MAKISEKPAKGVSKKKCKEILEEVGLNVRKGCGCGCVVAKKKAKKKK